MTNHEHLISLDWGPNWDEDPDEMAMLENEISRAVDKKLGVRVVEKHYGPGPHRTGSPQLVHAPGGPNLNEPFDLREYSADAKTMQNIRDNAEAWAGEMRDQIAVDLGLESRWGGKVILANETLLNGARGRKAWSCVILMKDSGWRDEEHFKDVLFHEVVHSFSVGVTKGRYQYHRPLEEGVVELVTRSYRPDKQSGYSQFTIPLRKAFRAAGRETGAAARELLSVPVHERYDKLVEWLGEKGFSEGGVDEFFGPRFFLGVQQWRELEGWEKEERGQDVNKALPIPEVNERGEILSLAADFYETAGEVDAAIAEVRGYLVAHPEDHEIADMIESLLLLRDSFDGDPLTPMGGEIEKHYGPGPHKSGTPQLIHGNLGFMGGLRKPGGGFTVPGTKGDKPKRFVAAFQGAELIAGSADDLLDDKGRPTPEARAELIAYIKSHSDQWSKPNRYLGGWHNEQNGKVYYDVSTSFENEAEARKFAKDNEQLAYADLQENEPVYIFKARRAADLKVLARPPDVDDDDALAQFADEFLTALLKGARGGGS